ncbi:MAG: type II toxin-antitoxin system VapC family toxin [Arhodomonas sp.]|nr:type II toxin-antitoxin system VapC family toxin [Arhodomonas sp.]
MTGELRGCLLDTNVVIGVLKELTPAMEMLRSVGNDTPLAYSAITRMELMGYPGLTAEEGAAIESTLATMTYMGLTHAIEDRAIVLRQNHRIKLPDAIIAATALEYSYRLLTLDEALAAVFATVSEPRS